MKILVAHNYYKLRGGEDVVFESEVDLLLGGGHEVQTLKVFNDDVKSVGAKAAALLGTVRNNRGIETVLRAIEAFRPDVVHFHNIFPLLSPAVYSACRKAGVAVVQTLHNFRPICPGSLLLRDGQICQLCVNGSSVPGILHRCYRNSFVSSAAAARMVSVHRQRGTWRSDVDRYIALTNFGRDKFVEAGFPAERIEVKPNFMADPGAPPSDRERSGVLYVGRLSPEKGVSILLQACRQLDCTLRIVGTGPDLPALKAQAGDKVSFLGALDRTSVLAEMARARVVVAPSIWFEGFGIVVVEAFACGTPVIASRLGALAEIVEDGVTGALVPPNDPVQLSDQLAAFLSNPGLTSRLGNAARRVFLERYTPAVSLKRLGDIYANAVEQFDASRHRLPSSAG
jgi:glycosyltransferase involved in cell wall biosynthesis